PFERSVAVWSIRATFMLPVVLNPPEPARAGVAVIATRPVTGNVVASAMANHHPADTTLRILPNPGGFLRITETLIFELLLENLLVIWRGRACGTIPASTSQLSVDLRRVEFGAGKRCAT